MRRSGWLAELRHHWRPLAAATVGLSAGLSLQVYANNVFGSHLVEAFGWSAAQYALIGTLSFMSLICIPIAGRLADLFGVRRVAAVGIIGYPLTCLLLSRMSGSFELFMLISVLQILLCASTTTTVYCRLVAECFSAARGTALAIAVAAPAAVGALGGPLLDGVIRRHDWSAGYLAFAIYSALAGALAWLLMRPGGGQRPPPPPRRGLLDGYTVILRLPAFWILFTASFLCSLPHALAFSQLRVMLNENGVSPATLSMVVTIFAVGVMAGRFLLGLALDRFPTHIAAALGMGAPVIGLLLMASGTSVPLLLAVAVFTLGLAFGAEGDILAYAVVKYFGMENYSTVLGLMMVAVGGAIAVGSLLLSAILSLTGSFRPFLLLTALLVFLGSLGFYMLRGQRESGVVLEVAGG